MCVYIYIYIYIYIYDTHIYLYIHIYIYGLREAQLDLCRAIHAHGALESVSLADTGPPAVGLIMIYYEEFTVAG